MALTLEIQAINGVNYKVVDVDGTGADEGDIIVVLIEKGGEYVPFIENQAIETLTWIADFDDWENKDLPKSHPNYDLKEANFTTFQDRLDGITLPRGRTGSEVFDGYVVDFDAFVGAEQAHQARIAEIGSLGKRVAALEKAVSELQCNENGVV